MLISSPQGQATTPNSPSCFHPWVPQHPGLYIGWMWVAAVPWEGSVRGCVCLLVSPQPGTGQGQRCPGHSHLGLLPRLL